MSPRRRIGLGGGVLVVAGSTILLVGHTGEPRFRNQSAATVWVKPEVGDHALPIRPGEDRPIAVDGVAVPTARIGQLFKVTDGCHATVERAGEIAVACDRLALRLVQWALGGWKDHKWLRALNDDGDHGWNALFAAAGDVR